MKRKIRRTGEIIDVITFNGSTIRRDYDKIQFYDSNGSVINESLNYYLDTLPVDDENKDVDWEQLLRLILLSSLKCKIEKEK